VFLNETQSFKFPESFMHTMALKHDERLKFNAARDEYSFGFHHAKISGQINEDCVSVNWNLPRFETSFDSYLNKLKVFDQNLKKLELPGSTNKLFSPGVYVTKFGSERERILDDIADYDDGLGAWTHPPNPQLQLLVATPQADFGIQRYMGDRIFFQSHNYPEKPLKELIMATLGCVILYESLAELDKVFDLKK